MNSFLKSKSRPGPWRGSVAALIHARSRSRVNFKFYFRFVKPGFTWRNATSSGCDRWPAIDTRSARAFYCGQPRVSAHRKGAYQVIQRLPALTKGLRYLIRSLEEEYKQIVDENDLGKIS